MISLQKNPHIVHWQELKMLIESNDLKVLIKTLKVLIIILDI